jgi:GDP-L-fucose synthase
VELISEIVGYTGRVIWDKTKPIGAQKRFLDIRNSRKILGYTPLTNLRDGLIETYEYFKKNYV